MPAPDQVVEQDRLTRLGLDPTAVAALLDRAERDVVRGRIPSCQLALAKDGEIAVTATFGDAGDDDRYLVFSVTKALVASAVWVLLGERALTPQTPVADLVPEFRTGGKERVTVEHLLTHTAGFPRAPILPTDGATSEGRRARFADWRLDWEPGSRTEYHAVSAHWVLAEIVEQTAGTDYRRFVHERVVAPLGLRRLQLGVPPEEQGDVRDVVLVAQEVPEGAEVPEIATDDQLLLYNRTDVRAVGVPGAGAVSTASDVALLYQAFLHNEPRIWDPEVLADATGHVRNTHLDPFTRVPANRTLGLVVAGDDGKADLREFGKAVGPRAFGASGLGGQIAWADPDTGMSFCYLTDGLMDLVRAFLRSSKLSTLAAECNTF
ncbi:MAG: serine hydrolase domain-containing protein [Actinomycetes bacterium]